MIAVLLGLLLSLFLAQLGLSLAGSAVGSPRLPLAYDQTAIDRIAGGDAQWSFDADLGWLPTPGFDRSSEDVRYRHNAQGLRADREYTSEPPAGISRIAAYGDSYTYCSEVNLDDCWTTQLEAALPGREVLNFGVGASAPDQALMRYQRDGSALRPCAVLIGHMVENINRVVNRFRPFYYPEAGHPLAKPRYVLEGDRLVLLPSPAREPGPLKDPLWVEKNLGPHDAWYFPGIFVANPLDRLELVSLTRTAVYRAVRRESDDWTADYSERVYQPGREAFDVLAAVLVGFAEQVRSDGATPIVLIFPMKAEILAQRDGGPKPHARLLETLERHGISFIDLTDYLGAAARRSSLATLWNHHYLPRGNAIVARSLAGRLPDLTSPTCGRA